MKERSNDQSILALLTSAQEWRGQPHFFQLSRRRLLEILGGAGIVALSGCGSGGTSTTSTSGATTATSSGRTASCVLTPELTVGPYFVDEKLNRSDLTTNTTDANVLEATPLTLTMAIMEYTPSGCSALVGAQVDVWHADAAGVYSDEAVENTTDQTYLRGYQITDSSGVVTFKTVIPGWYTGPTIHIHVTIRTLSSGSVLTEFTTQLFFDQTFLNALTTSVSPYNTRGTPDTTNSQDNIYTSTTQLTLASTTSGGGYTATITLGVQTT
jgi:protocatechuate 3,4-dioxygenase beta subunit